MTDVEDPFNPADETEPETQTGTPDPWAPQPVVLPEPDRRTAFPGSWQ